MIGFLAEEVRRQNELLLEAIYVPVERRVLRRLAELSALYAGRDSVIPLTQEQLAEMAGTSRATVNRVLREEQARGTVALRRGPRLSSTRRRSRAARAEPQQRLPLL